MKGKKNESGCKNPPQQSSLTPEAGARSAGLMRLGGAGFVPGEGGGGGVGGLLVSRRLTRAKPGLGRKHAEFC